MRRETAVVLAIVVLAVVTGAGLLLYAWPTLKSQTQTFPTIVTAEIYVGPQHVARVLSPQEMEDIEEWLKQNTNGWAPVVRRTPSSGDALIVFNKDLPPVKEADGKLHPPPPSFSLRIWEGINMADWNQTVILERGEGVPVKIKTMTEKEFAPLRLIINQRPYQRTIFP